MKKFYLGFLLSLLFVVILPSQAQAISVTAIHGEQEMIIRYADDRALQLGAFVEGINAATTVYRGIFPDSPRFKLFIDLVNESVPNQYAATQLETIEIPATTDGTTGFVGSQEVCRIRVYRAVEFANDNKTRHNAAHELAHCYHKFNINDAAMNDADPIKWWFEGSAEWMASLVYPATNSIILGNTQSEFVEAVRNNRSLLGLDYNAQYFWTFLGHNMGLSDIGTILKNMPLRPNQNNYLHAQIPNFPLAFHRYAVELGQGIITGQPANLSLFALDTRTIDFSVNSSYSITLDTHELALHFLELNFVDIAAGEGVKLNFSAGTDESFMSLDAGINLNDFGAEGYIHCAATPLRLVHSTSKEIGRSLSASSLTLEKVPCVPEPPAGVDECLVGHWQLDISAGFGPEGMPKSPVLWGGYTIDIYADGIFIAAMNIRVLERNSNQRITMQFYLYAQMTSLQNNATPAGRAIITTPMTIRSDIINQTIPLDRSAGVGGLRLSCSGNVMNATDPASGVNFRFLRR